MRKCKHCGYGNKPDDKFCKNCGKELVLLSTHYEGGGLSVKKKSSAKEGFECILFCVVIIAGMIAIVLWLLAGSPTEIGAIIGIGTFAAASDILIWKKVFSVENKTSIEFMKVKHDLELMENRINSRFDKIEDMLKKIK